ncbi:MAG: hypothetical protein HOB40_08195 [Candidatus Marinimicrobia bacterium]|jgi:hypothetical protein|nr:hypothetical protein [Candidatus Neomarinimicrobiota bacterium]MBT3502642.1 hypothetical protein [Candidatus Neomarinimicrobiota bacterium]MBT3839938.1 hypothetical protein [Candidatus Neomarinimicrobiota bacterium]MBT4000187.1 hypothetical protein [Candidatus Neomarinimicrobiota bacterium]MBT4281735.1 hypothetical protein [Candidatus Neomarinimicrobiota bacterium]
MDINRLNIYKRLRDFKVPASILDEIFSENEDFKLVEDAFDALIKDGFSEDEAAEEISIMIFKDADIDKSQLIDDEK